MKTKSPFRDEWRLKCPFCEDGVPHMYGVVFGRNVPPTSTSGPGLIISMFCEEGHQWNVVFEDHSACTSISVVRVKDRE